MSTRDRTVAAGRFKAECLSLLDDVAATGRPLVVTKRGRPVARVVPVARLKPGALKGVVRFVGDIVAPLDVEWGGVG
jgi:prevent-host-death family protein